MNEVDGVRAIKLAVVGHTNVGKTSLLRTLTRSEERRVGKECPV